MDLDTEVAEELDTTSDAAPTTGELDALEDGHDGDAAAAPTENKWNARRSLSELLEEDDAARADKSTAGKPGKQSTAPTGDAEDDGDDDDLDDDELEEDLEDDDDEDDEEEERPKQDAKKKGTDQEPPKGDAGKARYTIKGSDGKSFAFELQDGASIQFKGDGRDVEVKSIDELVQLAQKGVAFDRKTSEQGKAIQELTSSRTGALEQLAQVRKTAEETLMAALFDRDARQKLRAALAPYRDPNVRKAAEVLERDAEREKGEKATQAQTIEAKRVEFWQGVGSDIKKELGKFEHLTDADAVEVAQRFHQGYSATYQAKFDELTAAGTPEDKAAAQANAHAFSHFTEKNLRRVMRGLNAELAEERAAGKKGKAGVVDPKAKPGKKAGTAAAAAHNDRTDRALERRRRTPRLAGGGAAPGGSARVVADRAAATRKPLTFSQRMERAGRMLRGSDDE